jgi:hypothetical protein
MATGVRDSYHVAINGRGFLLRGTPSSPVYIKEQAPSVVNQLGIGDLNYNSLNGAGWSYLTQTDWAGGFQRLKFKDDASFKDGQAIDPIRKYGEISLQYGFTSAVAITGSHSFGAHGVHGNTLLLGTVKNAGAKIFAVTSAFSISTLSAMSTISAVNAVTRFGSNSIIGMTKQVAASASVKSMAKYTGSVISGFRSANPTVRAVKGIGIRLYSGELVKSLSGDVLYYSTDLSTFTSAYQAGKNRNIKVVEDLNGDPYFFIVEGRRVEMLRWDEIAERAYPIYTWEDLTNFSVKKYPGQLIVAGATANKKVAYSFNGARLQQIFDDQLFDSTYDFRYPFEFEGNYHNKGVTWDATYWFPGLYGKVGSSLVVPFENFANKAVGFISGSTMRLAYQDRTKYAVSGHVISSEFGANIAGVDKLLNTVQFNFANLATGQTIELYRSVDGGANFTSVGKASFAQDGAVGKKLLSFPSGYVTKLWNWKAQLVGPGTTTPILNDVTFEYRPVADLKHRWQLSIEASDEQFLLNKQRMQRDGKALVEELWLEKEAKRTIVFEDVNSFEANIVSAMAAADVTARVSTNRLMPPRGRIRVYKAGQAEEMTYTSADGRFIRGLSRGLKGTLARAYTSADKFDNNYSVVVTSVAEQLNWTDQKKTESIARVVLLEV